MTTPNTNLGPIVPPDLRSLLDTERRTTLVNCNKVQVGIVQAWDPATQSATVQLVNQRVVGNAPMQTSAIPPSPTVYTYPLLVQVPVWVLSGGDAFLGMPIKAGDFAIVLFNDRDLDPWWSNGTQGAPPNSSRVHSLADGMAIVGIRPATNPIAGLPSDGQHMTFGNSETTMLEIFTALGTALNDIVLALTALNAKTGPDASAAITTAATAVSTANDLPPELFQ